MKNPIRRIFMKIVLLRTPSFLAPIIKKVIEATNNSANKTKNTPKK